MQGDHFPSVENANARPGFAPDARWRFLSVLIARSMRTEPFIR